MSLLASPESFAFQHFRLDPDRRALLVHGAPVAISARAFDILELLVRSRDRVLSRDEIVAHVWQGQLIGENNLAVQVSNLRRVLAEHDADPQLIATVPGRGYRFIGEVTSQLTPLAPAAHDTPPPERDLGAIANTSRSNLAVTNAPIRARGAIDSRRRALTTVGLMVALLSSAAIFWHMSAPRAPRLSIVVLPFRNLSEDRTQDYLAEAISDDLTTDLAHLPGSVVIARQSADTYKGRLMAAAQIGHELNVRYLVEGSIRAENGAFHINTQLIDTSTSTHLWAERFDEPSDKLGEVRDTIVRRLASALDFQLSEIESIRSMHDRPDDPDAVDLFLRARAATHADDSLQGLGRAQTLLEDAIRKQPHFVDALTELGVLLLRKVQEFDDPNDPQDYAEAKAAIAQASALTVRNPDVLAAQARVLVVDQRCDEASNKASLALQIEPSNVDAHRVLARCAMLKANLDESELHFAAVLRLDPESPELRRQYQAIAFIRLLQGRAGETIRLVHLATATDDDPKPNADSMGRAEYARLFLIAAFQMNGNAAQARSLYKAYASIWPNRTTWRIGAYLSGAVSKLPGAQRFLSALHEAGMPVANSEQGSNSSDKATCAGGDFAASPATLAGGQTWNTSDVAKRLQGPNPPLVIDLGRGAGSLPGAVLFDLGAGQDTDEFAEHAAASKVESSKDKTIVVTGDGPFGCNAYNAARHLLNSGYPHVAWYRGGEEVWSVAGKPSEDRRTP